MGHYLPRGVQLALAICEPYLCAILTHIKPHQYDFLIHIQSMPIYGLMHIQQMPI